MTGHSEDQTWLKQFITEDLYIIGGTRDLDEPEEPAQEIEVENADKAPSKKVLIILVSEPPAPVPAGTMAFLKKILSAVQLHIEDTLIIDTGESSSNLDEIQINEFEKCIVFHPTLSLPGIGDDRTYVEIKSAGSTILRADLIAQIETETPKKKALWTALQSMFEIKK